MKENTVAAEKNTITLFEGEREIILTAWRGMYIPVLNAIVISDIHLGKTAHFRKNGIPLSAEVMQKDLQRLANLIKKFSPKTIIVVGDMFHNSTNSDVDAFSLWRNAFHHIEIILVAGNHDRLQKQHYANMKIEVVKDFEINGFYFIHENKKPKENHICISGHIHPGISIKTGARQSVSIPCYVQSGDCIFLPAFSEFTGLDLHALKGKNNIYFALANNKIFPIKPE